MIRLFDFKLSGSCHKVRMLLSMLHLEYQLINVDLLNGDQTQEQFLQINPQHKAPVLDDDGLVLRDSTAIMMYLAQKYGAARWGPKHLKNTARFSSGCPFRSMKYFTGWQRPERLFFLNGILT